jgi:hypothetical protein
MPASVGSFIIGIICFWTGEILLVIFTGGRHKFLPWNKSAEPGTRVLSAEGSSWVGGIFWVFILGFMIYLVR